MGKARYVLSMEITRNRPKRLLGMCQKAYKKGVLKCFRIHYSKPVDIPAEKGLALSLDQCSKTEEEKERMMDIPYANVVGSLMYAMLCAWSDIGIAVGLVSCYQNNP